MFSNLESQILNPEFAFLHQNEQNKRGKRILGQGRKNNG
jgi:hypothetical protein